MVNTPSVVELREAALAYAARGWAVFPVQGKDRPATEHGFKDASTNRVQIEAWWAYIPYNIGIALGPESGIFVVDVDPRSGGEWTPKVRTYSVRTGGRYEGAEPGTHYYFNWPAGVAKMRSRLAQGVDIKGAGGYVVAPPSVTDDSYTVQTHEGTTPQVVDAPMNLLSLIAVAAGAVDIDARPGDIFNDTHTWAELLEPCGWSSTGRQMDSNGDTVEAWTRPGKDEGISATTGIRSSLGDPSDLLYVFTTSTSLEPNRGYDKFGFYALMEHDGDVSAAASALADQAPRGTGLLPTAAEPEFRSSPFLGTPVPQYTYTSDLPAEHFVSRYVQYGSMLTDAALEYHEAAALVLLAAVTPQVRIELAPYPDGLATNLYVALIGESSRSRKSTVQQTAAQVINRLMQDAVLPDRMTGEAAISQLANRSNGTALWLPDELGVTLQQVYQRDFMRAIEELLLTLYSGQTYRYVTQGNGTQTITGVHLTVLGASTPESFGPVGSKAISSGLLPRFGIVYPAAPPPSRALVAASDAQRLARQDIELRLREVMLQAALPGGPRRITFTLTALNTLGGIDSTLSKHRLTARLSVAAYKVASLLALADGKWEVDAVYAGYANTIVQRWAQGAMRLREHLGRPATDLAFMELLDISREKLREAKGLGVVTGRKVITRAEAAGLLNVEHRTLTRVRDSLADRGEIIVVKNATDQIEEWHYYAG